jgi:hypothetical protein
MNSSPILLVTASVLIAGCSSRIKGNGVIVTENRPTAEFSTIRASGAIDVQWSSGQPALAVVADENLLPYIKADVTGNELRLYSDQSLAPTKQIKVTISSRALTDVRLAGAVSLSANQVTGQNLRIEAAGAVGITANGSVTELAAVLTGASKLAAGSLKTQSATITLTGACQADIAVAETLKASITGAGSLTYSGNPKSVERNVTGAGSIQQRP